MSQQEHLHSGFKYLSNLNSFTWLSLVVFFCYFYWRSRPHAKFPPGPIGFPIVGVIPYFTKSPAKDFKKWSLQKYGPIMSVRMGLNEVVVLNTFDVIHEAFVKQGSAFSDRAWNILFCRKTGHDGFIFKKYDDDFKSEKHFALKYFREKGLGKKKFETLINEEGDRLVELLQDHYKPDDTINLKEHFCWLTSNVIMQTAFGKHYDYSDKEFGKILKTVEMLVADPKHSKKLSMVVGLGFLAGFPPFSGAVKAFEKKMLVILGFIKDRIQERRKRFDPDNVDDYIDSCLNKQRNGMKPQKSEDAQMIAACRDIFLAGSETSSTILTWLIVYYLNFPNYQKSINDEIDNILGTSGIPTMAKRLDMPVTCAFIQEVMRVRTILPLVEHYTSAQVELEGFVLPKGTTVLGNLYGANMDPETWPNPEKFNPHRHIDEEGKFVASNKIIPFSIGPRFCLGESLARVEIFVFFVKIIQNFTIRSANGKLPTLDSTVSVLVMPKDCKVKLKTRN